METHYTRLSPQPRSPSSQAQSFRQRARALYSDALTLALDGRKDEAARLRRDAATCQTRAEAIEGALRADAEAQFGKLK